MKHFRHIFGYVLGATLLGLIIAPGAARAQQAAPSTPTAPVGNPENGRKAFVAHTCYTCHGYSAEGGVGAHLVGYSSSLKSFAAYVRKPLGNMPPAGATVTAQDIADIYAFVRSIPASPDPKTIELLKP